MEDLHTLRVDRSEDLVRVSGSLDGQNISLTRTTEGISGNRGDQALPAHEAEMEYLRLRHAIAERDQVNDAAIGRIIDEIDKHNRVLSRDAKEKASPIEGAQLNSRGYHILKVGSITYESTPAALKQDAFEILRDGFQLGVEAAEKINSFPYSKIPFTVRCENFPYSTLGRSWKSI